MTLIKWTPRALARSEDELTELFEHFLRPFDEYRLHDGLNWHPTANIVESKDAYEVSVELPGVKKDEIDVNVENNVLSISGKRKEAKKEKDKEYHRIERRYGSFCRTFSLPAKIEAEKIKASYKDGILTLELPKAAEAKKKTVRIDVS